uniref:Uncharacterized protein n=1 Tax=Arion vulgaris TaxID=1028688 RepID=A0A0B7AKU2_9EUPU
MPIGSHNRKPEENKAPPSPLPSAHLVHHSHPPLWPPYPATTQHLLRVEPAPNAHVDAMSTDLPVQLYLWIFSSYFPAFNQAMGEREGGGPLRFLL